MSKNYDDDPPTHHPLDGHDDSHDDNDDIDLPRHLLPSAGGTGGGRHRGGWQGEEMEMEHQLLRSKQQQHSNTVEGETQKYAAVDLNQFRNTVVGQGYQAKHVVRQRTAASGTTAPPQMPSRSQPQTEQPRPTKDSAPASSSGGGGGGGGGELRGVNLQTLFLQNDGIRTFVKEINDILSSSS